MATISPHKLSFPNPQIPSSRRSHHLRKRPSYPSLPPRFPDSTACRCCTRSDSPSPPDSPGNRRWDSVLQQVFRNGLKAFDSVVNLYRKEQKTAADGTAGRAAEGRRGDDEDWDWDRWKKHFDEVDEQERLVSVLKSQLGNAVCREDYEDAAMLKVAIAAAAKNDTVGRVMYNLSRAIKEERYQDAAFMRDYASAGLIGWWSGYSDDSDDPYGLIVCITAEHGRYVAKSFSPRQLASAAAGVPLFEIFLTMNKKGEYKQQAVFLKQSEVTQDSPTISSRASGVANRLNPSDLTEDNTDVLVVSHDDVEDTDDIDDGLSSFQNIVRDMNPGAMVKVSKETASGKVDRDFMSKMIEDITEDEDEDDEDENEDEDEEEDVGVTSEGTDDELKDESDQEIDEIEINIGDGFISNEEEGELDLKIVVGGLVENLSSNVSAKELLRMPAKLDKKGRFSFSFSIEEGTSQQDPAAKEQVSKDRKDKLRIQRIMDRVTLDISKAAGKEKIPMKALKDIGELISLSLRQVQNRPSLSGSTTFSRIEIPSTSDPLNGLYIGARGLNASEVIHMRRKFGYWQEDGGTKDPSNLEFYEYVEALKLTGDPNVPAGQVAFRAKVGKRNQLPHKGIIPEEFGVIARYKGQGRLAEPGFKNPRWVDGELVVLDGKYIKEGPVVGFVYWAPEYHFLVFFNRLRLQD